MMFKLLGFAAMAVTASATNPWACGNKGEQCCNQTDCIGNTLVCNKEHTSKSECVDRTLSHCGECCGEDDCPYGTWCTDDNKCELMCGTEGGECCNGTDCVGNGLMCEHPKTKDSVCVPAPPEEVCGEKVGSTCCNHKDCNGDNKLVCDTDKEECVECGGDWQPPCAGNQCQANFEPIDNKCMPCGKEHKSPCPYNQCRDDLVAIHQDGEYVCLRCGGKGEIPCPNRHEGCDDDLVEIDGLCAEESCGEIGELPCKDGCKDGRMSAEAAGGVCVRSCGDPKWVCCDGPTRCKKSGRTCVDKEGEDKDGIPFWQACEDCGGEGEPVCEEPGDDECEKGLWAMNGRCMRD